MNSPFPGMDPYIEGMGLWEDFHHNLITEIQGAISAALPDRYVVRTGERSYVVLSARDGDEEFLTQPDVGVAQLSKGRPAESLPQAGTTAVLEAPEGQSNPIIKCLLVETEHREGFLEIREVNAERKLVTLMKFFPFQQRLGSHGLGAVQSQAASVPGRRRQFRGDRSLAGRPAAADGGRLAR